jgi:hypothetical protein
MSFTPNVIVRAIDKLVVATAVIGVIWCFAQTAPAPAPIPAQPRAAFVMPAVLDSSASAYYQPVTAWYKSKHWWKRNAPIVGGAGGGAIVGGLVGGGTGAIIGGAAGGGAGYAYKRLKHKHYSNYHSNYHR